jgi:hypothetical protein
VLPWFFPGANVAFPLLSANPPNKKPYPSGHAASSIWAKTLYRLELVLTAPVEIISHAVYLHYVLQKTALAVARDSVSASVGCCTMLWRPVEQQGIVLDVLKGRPLPTAVKAPARSVPENERVKLASPAQRDRTSRQNANRLLRL